MTTPTHSSYDWVRQISPDLKKLDTIPLTGATPPFPWEDLSSRLAQIFELEEIAIKTGETAWRTKETLYEGLDSPYPLNFTLPSLKGQVSWVVPAQELDRLAALLLTQETHPLTFHEPVLSESFYQFLALEVLYQLTQVPFDKVLAPTLTNQSLPPEDSLCKDIFVTLKGQTVWGRLILSPEFRLSWVDHFAQLGKTTEVSTQLAKMTDVVMHVEAGKCDMTLKEWNEVSLGDFILLDSCLLEPESFTGRVRLTLNDRLAFRAKLKDGSLKILELPLLHEVETPMAKQPEHENEDEFSDLDLPEEEEEEFGEEDLFSDDDLLSEEHETEENEQHTEEEPEAREAHTTEKEHAGSPAMVALEQIPLTLTVEVGQIQLSVDQLMKLEPGNLLEIDIQPEHGVNLTIHGKVVAKGELIRIGDAIGVRIMQLP